MKKQLFEVTSSLFVPQWSDRHLAAVKGNRLGTTTGVSPQMKQHKLIEFGAYVYIYIHMFNS